VGVSVPVFSFLVRVYGARAAPGEHRRPASHTQSPLTIDHLLDFGPDFQKKPHVDCKNDMDVYSKRMQNVSRSLANKYIRLCIREGRRFVNMSLPLNQRSDSTNDGYPYRRLLRNYDDYILWLLFSSHTKFKTQAWCEWARVFWPQLGVDTVQDLAYVDRATMGNSAAWNQLCEAHKNLIGTLFGYAPDGYPIWIESARACLQGLCRDRMYAETHFNQESLMVQLLKDINESNYTRSQQRAFVRPAEVKMPFIAWKFLPDPGLEWDWHP